MTSNISAMCVRIWANIARLGARGAALASTSTIESRMVKPELQMGGIVCGGKITEEGKQVLDHGKLKVQRVSAVQVWEWGFPGL
ncbi:conserved hypothetical protein [Ricinus communis]|uniref:Uncharacterized protein n=1 Tax=Ricinus communis TaxID=3988 RepID=B9RPR9_RICCO|nr:conserved hypothetical protein [Ricinus communis]